MLTFSSCCQEKCSVEGQALSGHAQAWLTIWLNLELEVQETLALVERRWDPDSQSTSPSTASSSKHEVFLPHPNLSQILSPPHNCFFYVIFFLS